VGALITATWQARSFEIRGSGASYLVSLVGGNQVSRTAKTEDDVVTVIKTWR
jgi:hypothetical protein